MHIHGSLPVLQGHLPAPLEHLLQEGRVFPIQIPPVVLFKLATCQSQNLLTFAFKVLIDFIIFLPNVVLACYWKTKLNKQWDERELYHWDAAQQKWSNDLNCN